MMMTKGGSLIAYLEFLRSKFDNDSIDKVKHTLSQEDQTMLFSRQVLAISKLDIQSIINFLKKADELLGKNDMELFKNCLRYKAQKELKGIYKIFVSFTSPHFIIKKVSNVWKQLYTQGEATADVVSEKSTLMKIINAPDMPKYHDVAIVAYVEEALKISGCKNPRGIIEKSIPNGADHCLIRFIWL